MRFGLLVVLLSSCSSPRDCQVVPLTGGPNLSAIACDSTHAALKIVGDSCTIPRASSCKYALTGTTLQFSMQIERCTGAETTSTGCSDVNAICFGPALAPGTYSIDGQPGAALVVDAAGCHL